MARRKYAVNQRGKVAIGRRGIVPRLHSAVQWIYGSAERDRNAQKIQGTADAHEPMAVAGRWHGDDRQLSYLDSDRM